MSEKPTLDYLLRSTWHAVQRMYNEQAAAYDSTMVTGFTLLSIDPNGGTPSTALGPKMGLEATSLSRTLKNLEERELIQRKPNPEDGRGVLICLTKEGRRMRQVSKEVVLLFNETIEREVGSEKLQCFREVMQSINILITENKIFSIHEKSKN